MRMIGYPQLVRKLILGSAEVPSITLIQSKHNSRYTRKLGIHLSTIAFTFALVPE